MDIREDRGKLILRMCDSIQSEADIVEKGSIRKFLIKFEDFVDSILAMKKK